MSVKIITFMMSQLRFVGYNRDFTLMCIPSDLFYIFPEEYREKSFEYEDDNLSAYITVPCQISSRDDDFFIVLEIDEDMNAKVTNIVTIC